VAAAAEAAREAAAMPLSRRYVVVEAMREACRVINAHISEWAVRESGLGRVEDKLKKNPLLYEKTPGPEILEPKVFTGDDGLTLCERAPFGVIASITPTTNPTETVICNAIAMVAGGNAVVFNAHPAAREVTNFTVDVLGRAIALAGGPRNLLTAVREPSIESAQALMSHPGVRLLVVTGGPGVVREAMGSGKKVIAAGPGNPPAVVDETADVERAARHIVNGATLDNNIVCIAEKEIVAVAAIADRLREALRAQPALELTPEQVAAVEQVIIAKRPGPGSPHGEIQRRFVGKNAAVILGEIGVTAGPELRLLFAEVERDHPFVQMELMMPVLGLVRVPDVEAAISFAREVEHGNHHTATMHSRNVESMSRMARVIDTSIFVKNGPSYAGCGLDGEGYTSFTIASPTGEGLTTAVHFTRERRCTLKDSFRIV
jgi:acyl-CoA reductase-like NAD-dependent aldehyde dehydrogenase